MVLVDGIVIEQPVDVNGQITLGNGALHCYRVAKVSWLIAKLKGSYVGRHLMMMKTRKVVVIKQG